MPVGLAIPARSIACYGIATDLVNRSTRHHPTLEVRIGRKT